MFPFLGMGGGGSGGMGQGNMGSGNANMAGGSGMPNALGALAGMNTAGGLAGNGGLANPAGMMAGMNMMNPTMQALYQQYAIRWAAMQKFAQAAQASAAAMGNSMGGGMAGNAGMGRGGGGMGMGPGAGAHGGQGPRGAPPMGAGLQEQVEDPGVFYKTRICNKWREGHCPFSDTCKYAHGDHELRTMDQNLRELGGGSGRVGHGGAASGGRGAPQHGGSMGGRGDRWGGGGGSSFAGPDSRGGDRGSDRGERDNSFKKTRLCEEFMQSGACRYGSRCSFAHGHHELRQAAGGGAGGGREPPAMDRRQGPGGQQSGGPPVSKDNMRKTRLCEKFMQTGSCGYGDKCTFAHGTHELRPKLAGGPPSAPGGGGGGGGGPSGGNASGSRTHGGSAGGANGLPSSATNPRQQTPSQPPASSTAAPAAPAQAAASLGYGQGNEERQGDGGEGGTGGKRRLEDVGDELGGGGGGPVGGPAKKAHVEEEVVPEPACALCAQLVRTGRAKVLSAIDSLESGKAKQLGAMILATSQRLDQLWDKVTPQMVLGWLSKTQGLTVMDKIELLKTVVFHVHTGEDGEGGSRGGLEAASKYVDMGLPADCANFVYMCMEGQEGNATMSEYFHMLEVCKQLFGINDDNYYTVSTAVAGIMMGM